MVRRISIIVVVVALVCGAYYLNLREHGRSDLTLDAAMVDNGTPAIGGAFSLTDQDGKMVTDENLKGKRLLVFFGYTSCPDECPVTMAVISEVMNQLGDAGVKNVQPIFITTDPDTDKPAVLKKYLKDYHHGFIGLTGSKDEIEKVEKEYKVYAADAPKTAMKMGDMSGHAGGVEHSALIYYMGEDGKYLGNFNRESAPEDIVEKIGK